MKLSKDRSGRVPFSMVAVVILLGSIVTGAYMQQANNVAKERRGRSADADVGFVIPQLRADLEEMASRCIEDAVDRQAVPDADEGSQGLWRVDQSFRQGFARQLGQEWGLKRLQKHGLTVEAGNASVQLALLPMSIRAINRLGMAVNMTAPAGFRAAGAVNFTFTLASGQKLEKSIDIELDKANWYPLALFQANRLRRDCVNEGLLELLFKEMFRGYLDTDFERMLSIRNRARRDDPFSTLTVGDLWRKRNLDEPGYNAVDLAIAIEEQVLFGGTRGPPLANYMNITGNRPLDLSSAMDHPGGGFRGAAAFDEGVDGGLKLDLGPFFPGVPVSSADGSGAGAKSFGLLVNSLWLEPPRIEFCRLTFAGEEVGVDVYLLEVTVNGVYRLMVGPNPGHILELDIPVHLQFTIDHRIRADNGPWSERGQLHCGIEDLELFDSEYAGLYCTPAGLALDITDSTGTQARQMADGCSLDLSIDGDYLGTFRRDEVGPAGLVLFNVPTGPHQLSVLWKNGIAGESEQGSASIILNGTGGNVPIITGRQPDSSIFWTCALAYLRDTPASLRLARLVGFLSMQAGYPVPDGAGSMSMGSPESARFMQNWLAGIERSLGLGKEPLGHSAPARAAVLDGAGCTVDVIRESLRWMERVDEAVRKWNALHPGSPVDPEPSICYANRNGAESFSCRAEGAFGSETLSLDRPASAADWKASGAGAGSNAGPGWSGRIRFGAAMDVGVTIMLVVSAYFKYVKYETTDGTSTAGERLDLSLELIKATLQVTRLMVKHVLGSVSGTFAKSARAASMTGSSLGVLLAVVTIIQLVLGERQKFGDDPESWRALLTGLDLETVMLHLSIGALVLGLVETGFACAQLTACLPFFAPVWAVLALMTLVCFMVLDWNAFSTFVSGTLTDGDRDKLAGSIQRTLRDTAGTVARLNEYPSDAEMLSARQARGAASLLAGMASFVNDPGMSFELRNLSRHQFDMAWAREHQARAVRSLRFFAIAMWEQVDEFGGSGWTLLHPFQQQNWDSRIMITWPDGQKARIELDYIRTFLLRLNASAMERTGIDFDITGRVVVDRLKLWMDPLARIGSQVQLWSKRLSASQDMKAYVLGLDGIRYRNDWGLLRLRLSPTFSSCTVRVACGAGFDFQDGTTSGRASILQKTITRSGEATYLYLEPGTYTLEFLDQRPDLALAPKNGRATVKVVGLYAPGFGERSVEIQPDPGSIYFQINNEYNGSIRVHVDVLDQESMVVGALGTVFEYDGASGPGGKEYISDRWVPGFCFGGSGWWTTAEQAYSLSLRIRFTVELDRESDGIYELRGTRTVHMYDIRIDHIERMRSEGNIHDDQLGYRLSVLNEPFMQKYGEDAAGNDLFREQYLKWEKI